MEYILLFLLCKRRSRRQIIIIGVTRMSVKKLIPLLDRVLVQKIVPPSKFVGGVLLPESAAQKVCLCFVCIMWFVMSRHCVRKKRSAVRL